MFLWNALIFEILNNIVLVLSVAMIKFTNQSNWREGASIWLPERMTAYHFKEVKVVGSGSHSTSTEQQINACLWVFLSFFLCLCSPRFKAQGTGLSRVYRSFHINYHEEDKLLSHSRKPFSQVTSDCITHECYWYVFAFTGCLHTPRFLTDTELEIGFFAFV